MARLEKALDVEDGEIGFPRAGGQLDEEAAFPEEDGGIQRTHAVRLIRAEEADFAGADVFLVDRDEGEILAVFPLVQQALKIPLEKKEATGRASPFS